MKVGLVLVFAAVALLSSSTAWKSKKKSLSIDMTDSKYKPWIPKIKKQSLSKFDDNKRKVLEKVGSAKGMEDFLKLFKIPFKKVRKPAIKINKNIGKNPMVLGVFGGKGPKIASSDKISKDESEEYELFVSPKQSPPLSRATLNIKSSSTAAVQPRQSSAPLATQDLSCKPRPTVYSLAASYSYVDYPACFQLNQCGGCCKQPGYVCRPTSLELQKVTHLRIFYATNAYEAKEVTLSHHKTCSCQCKLEESDCLPTQYLDKNYCFCACKQNSGQCPGDKVWSSSDCGCVCKKNPQQCGFRQQWDPERCQCGCKPEKCATGHRQDPSTCYCVFVSG